MDSLLNCILANEAAMDTLMQKIQKRPDVFNKKYDKKPVLHYAVQYGHLHLTDFLLKNNVDVNALCDWNQTALHAAATSKIRLEHDSQKLEDLCSCVRLLIQTNKADMNTLDCSFMTPLHLALQHNDDLAAIYLEGGADVETINRYARFLHPIHEAAISNNIDGIELLLKHGATVNARSNMGNNPLGHVMSHCDVSKVAKHPDTFIKTARYLFEKKKISHLSLNTFCRHALCLAVRLNRPNNPFGRELSKIILSMFLNKKNANKMDDLGLCPIHYSVFNNCFVLNDLVDLGCDVNSKDNMGRTCVHLIPIYLRLDTNNKTISVDQFPPWPQFLSDLISHGASLTSKDAFGCIPLHYSVDNDCKSLTETLLLHNKDSVNISNKIGMTPLHIAASNNDVELVELLINHGALVNSLDHYSASPLHHACFAKAAEVVQVLVKHKANLSLKNKCKQTPLDVAKYRHSSKIVMILLQCLKLGNKRLVENGLGSKRSADILLPVKLTEEETHESLYTFNNDEQNQIKYLTKEELKNNQTPAKILAELYTIPGVGLVSPAMPEVSEIGDAVSALVQQLVVQVEKLDDRFRGKLIPSGSFFENTKVGDPDEFDFMVQLESFTNLELNVTMIHEKKPAIIVRRYIQSLAEFFWYHMEYHGPFLDSVAISSHFTVLLGKAIASSVQVIHENLAITVFPGILKLPTTVYEADTSACIQCIWNGTVYKALRIGIDVVPCFHFTEWPECARKSGFLSLDMFSQGHHWLPTERKRIPRMSFSSVEGSIIRNLPDEVRKSYIYAKILRNKCVCPNLDLYPVLADRHLICNPHDFISSFLLKNIFLDLVENELNDFQNICPVKLVYDIYAKFEKCILNQSSYLYFLPQNEKNREPKHKVDDEAVCRRFLYHIFQYLSGNSTS